MDSHKCKISDRFWKNLYVTMSQRKKEILH